MDLWKKFLHNLPVFLYWTVAIGASSVSFLVLLATDSFWMIPITFLSLGLTFYMIYTAL